MIDKWTRKWLKVAKALADDNNVCFSRKIGSVIVSKDNILLGTGYNGPLRKIPHNDSQDWILFAYNNLLDNNEKQLLNIKYGPLIWDKMKGKCLRRELELKSGEKRHYCSCECSEKNAIFNSTAAGHSTRDAIIYCYCVLPCFNCASAIIQSQISQVVCLKSDKDYSSTSRQLFDWANIVVEEVNEKEI